MNAQATLIEPTETLTSAARILVVEDERIVARSLRKQLTSLGYEVVACVPSGMQAIQLTGSLYPDLVLMDIHLEGDMDGVQAAAAIRRLYHIPVVYLTAYSNHEILQRAKLTEPFGYILKPYEDRELQVVIETGLYKHRIERRQAERERWFSATLKSVSDGVVAMDSQECVTYMNPLAEQFTGWTSREALGLDFKQVVQIFRDSSRKAASSPHDLAMQNEDLHSLSLLITRDGKERTVEHSVSLIRDENGEILGSVIVFRDVTLRKRIEEKSRVSRHLETIGRLAGGVAHAFNNLMTIVLGHSDIMMREMKPGNSFFASAQEIHRSAMRTATLAQKLLAFGRKQLLTNRYVDLTELVLSLAPAIRLMKTGVRLDLRLSSSPCPTLVDKDQLEEALMILVRNACDAMPEGGKLTLRTKNVELDQHATYHHPEVQPGPYVTLSVTDTGAGMTPEALESLFEPFVTLSPGADGGLGMASVYGFVKQSGGDVEVRSELSQGTTFRLLLPREERKDPPPTVA